jgi:hypothetical protein
MLMGYKPLDMDVFRRNREASQQRVAEQGEFQERFKLVVAPYGKSPARNVLRIMPPHENMTDFLQEGKIHFGLGPNFNPAKKQYGESCNCPKYWNKDAVCKACLYVEQLRRDARSTDDPIEKRELDELARRITAKLRWGLNVVDCDHPERGVQPWYVGRDLEPKLRDLFIDDQGNTRDITDPKTGRNILITAVRKDKNTEFIDYPTIRPMEESSALHDMDWLDQIRDFSDLTREPTEADMDAAMRGERPARRTESQRSAPPPRASRATPRGAAAPAPAPAAPAAAPAERPRRQAVAPPVTAPAAPVDPWAEARAQINKMINDEQLSTALDNEMTWPRPITVVEFAAVRQKKSLPVICFSKDSDPRDSVCQNCLVLLPCYTLHPLGLDFPAEAGGPWDPAELQAPAAG